MIQFILSPNIEANNKLAKKISRQLDYYSINLKDLLECNKNLNQCLIDIYSLIEKYKRIIIYGQYDENNYLLRIFMEYVMNNLHYQLVIHNINLEENNKSYYNLSKFHKLIKFDINI